MSTEFVINNKPYEVDGKLLLDCFDCLLYNESHFDDEEKFVYSFVEDRISKTNLNNSISDEIILKGELYICQLLCNIDNLFGYDKAMCYATSLSENLGNFIDVEMTDWSLSLSATEAIALLPTDFNETDSEKFKQLFAAMILFQYVGESYKQTVTDDNEFDNIFNVNGFVFNTLIRDGKYILKPVWSMYDSSEEKYAKIEHVLVPPTLLNSLYLLDFSKNNAKYEDKSINSIITPESFFLKFKQLTGYSVKTIPNYQIHNTSKLSSHICGKWYHIYKSDGFMAMYYIRIIWFNADGTFKRSVVSQPDIPTAPREDWRRQNACWKVYGNQIAIKDSYSHTHSIDSFTLENSVLHIGNDTFYKEFKDALNHIYS